MGKLTLTLTKRQIGLLLGTCLVLGLFIRIFIAYSNTFGFDMSYYRKWSEAAVENGLFHIYGTLEGSKLEVDYPPVFLFCMYIVGLLRQLPVAISYTQLDMLILRIFQVLADTVLIWAVYYVVKKQNKILGVIFAFVWAICPAAIYNSSYWGQTDAFMMLFLILAFYFLEQKRPIPATVFYALAGLTKLQSLYFAPLFLLILFKKYDIKKALKSFGIGILTGVLIFLPFMINSGITLPFDVYLGGFGKYDYIVLNSMNLYGAVGLNGRIGPYYPEMTPFFNILGWVMLIAAFVFVVYLYFKARNRCPYLLCYLLLNSIFMFTTKMHERYQIPILIFLLIASARHKSGQLFALFVLQSIIIFLNHFMVYELFLNESQSFFANSSEQLFILYSICNVILYVVGTMVAIQYLYANKELKEKDTKEDVYDNCQTA